MLTESGYYQSIEMECECDQPEFWLKEIEISDDEQMWNDAANHGNEVWGEY